LALAARAAVSLRALGCAVTAGLGLAAGDGAIFGKRSDAFPAPMMALAMPFRSGTGPSGRMSSCEPAPVPADGVVVGEADAVVTAMVSAAAGGVHFVVVTTLAVAVSCTDLTEVALAATGI